MTRVTLSASFFPLELLSMPAVKRFSVSYARHPTNGMFGVFESIFLTPSLHALYGCSKVDLVI